jgi:prepilin-type processing-associated H-X9-DG protein
VAIVGPGPPWQAGKKTAHAAETESSLNPAIVAEVAGTEIQWMEPRDLTIDEVSQSISSDGGPSHTGDCGRYEDFFWSYDSSGANVLFADGSVTYIRKGAPAELITAILHGDQKRIEELDQYWWDPERHVRWGNCFALAGLVFSVAAMLLWPRQRNRKGDGQERNCEQANDKPA